MVNKTELTPFLGPEGNPYLCGWTRCLLEQDGPIPTAMKAAFWCVFFSWEDTSMWKLYSTELRGTRRRSTDVGSFHLFGHHSQEILGGQSCDGNAKSWIRFPSESLSPSPHWGTIFVLFFFFMGVIPWLVDYVCIIQFRCVPALPILTISLISFHRRVLNQETDSALILG